jgi:peptide subunit release factor RF-3
LTIENKFLDLFGDCINEYGPNSAQVIKLRAIISAHFPQHRDRVANPSLYESKFTKDLAVKDASMSSIKAVDMSTLFAEQKKSGLTNITPSVVADLVKNETPLTPSEGDMTKSVNTDESVLREIAELSVEDIIERLKRSGMESLSVKLGFNISKKKNNTEFATLLKTKLQEASK